MSEIATTGTVLTEEDVKERVDVGIAFLVLLFMGGLGAYLMTSGDSDVLAGFTAEPSSAAAATVATGASGSGVESGSVFEERARERAAVQAPVEAVPIQAAQSVVSDAEASVPAVVALPPAEAPPAEKAVDVQQAAEPIFQPVVEPEPIAEPTPEPVVETVIETEIAPELAATVNEEESALLKLATDSVSFVTGSAVLTEQSTKVLDDIGALLRSRPNSRLSVIGYTDSQGDPDENVALSFARAEACRDYLLGQGAKVGQVDSAGMGARRPVGDNATSEGRRANRRVEFTLLKGK